MFKMTIPLRYTVTMTKKAAKEDAHEQRLLLHREDTIDTGSRGVPHSLGLRDF